MRGRPSKSRVLCRSGKPTLGSNGCLQQSSDCPDSAKCPKANDKFASLSVDDDVEVWDAHGVRAFVLVGW